MKLKNIILTALLTFVFSGCVNLNYNEDVVRDSEWVYNSPFQGIRNMVSDVYGQRFSEFKDDYYNTYSGATLASATDEADFANSISNIHKYYNGGWTPGSPFANTWTVAYRAITEIHYYLENISKVNLEDYRYDSNYQNIVQQFELFPYELRFLRAYFYFELAKSYGDVPLVVTTLTNAQANSVERTPAQDVFKFIVDECDAVAAYLPVTYMTEPIQDLGRATRPAALALKARALLYAASPLFNKDNNKELWKQAAAAAKELIDKAPGWGITLSPYKDLWGQNAWTNPEFIMAIGGATTWLQESNRFEMVNYPVGVENGNSGNCPTQSLVDAYEYKNDGQTFLQKHPGQINVTQENPYDGLDPRFALTVVKNGDTWPTNNAQAKAIQSYEGGFNGSPKYNATTTGYYLRKYVDGNCVTTYNNQTTRRHTWIYMRLAEEYLNYAEAMFNYYGDADAKGDFGMSANEAVNVLRNRDDIKMPAFSGSDKFMERYMRERMVEFAFEDQRFWDIRRWKKGNEFFTSIAVANLQIVNDDVMLNRSVKTRQWDDKYYLYPIPQLEIQKNPKMTQNPGW
jgi:hypothetical protein